MLHSVQAIPVDTTLLTICLGTCDSVLIPCGACCADCPNAPARDAAGMGFAPAVFVADYPKGLCGENVAMILLTPDKDPCIKIPEEPVN